MHRYYHAAGRAGIAYYDAHRLAVLAHRIHRWHEHECNGTRVVHAPGHATTADGRRVPDTYSPAVAEVRSIVASYPGTTATIHGDPRGATLTVVTADGTELRL